ncbi:MAG: GerAB/ArcD/ProY family transporter [Syntrophomonadaceae bacterium]|nr:GerAB/ArcD/ProY family transporter [Syntrophomonadaceae bacterium]
MFRITNFQLYCLLFILVAPIAVFEQPHRLIHILFNNAWLAFIAAIVPAILLALMFSHIIKKSTQPFPLILHEHLGKYPGFILGILYIGVFILTCSFNLRVFIEFMKTNVLPNTPISIFIGVIIFLGFVAIKSGLNNIARIGEIFIITAVPLLFFIVLLALFSSFHIDRIYPVGYMDYKSFGLGVFVATLILGKMMPILTLAFFIPDKNKTLPLMTKVIFTYLIMMALITFSIIVTLGTYPALNFVFPSFNMLRFSHLGEFVQNLEIVIVALMITGFFGAFVISWFMTCYTTQKLFNLKDYRFLAAPTSVMIGILSIIISQNVLEVVIWSMTVIIYLFAVFFIIIPFIVFIICLFKADPATSNFTGEENSPEFS